jgi:linoleoyl-CoA desaturase
MVPMTGSGGATIAPAERMPAHEPPETAAPAGGLPRRCAALETRLRRFRARELANRNRPSAARVALDLASRLVPMVAGYLGTVLVDFPANVPAILLFAVANVSMLGSWFHDAVHRNVDAPRPAVELLARVGSAAVGFSPRWWSYKHVRMHHRFVSNPEFDPDIQFSYLARVSSAQPWRRPHATQHVHMWLLLPLATLNMLKPSELWAVRRFRRYSGLGAPPSGWRFLADRYPLLALVWLPAFLAQGPRLGFLCFLLFQLAAGTLVSVITQVQHNTALSDDGDDYSARWPLCEQLARTTDAGGSTGFWWWLSGGTNFHVAHHLIPSLSFLELPAVTARLRADLAAIGVPYPAHDGLVEALRSHAKLLRTLARPR